VDLTIFGYDPQIAALGVELLARLPAGTTARMISTNLSEAQRRAFTQRAGAARLSFAPIPSDGWFRASLASSALVFCKNGFQQIVESLAVGTPAIAVPVAGGVPEEFLDGELRPFVHYLSERPDPWEEALARARQWMAERPRLPWTGDLARLASPVRYGAEIFADLLREAVAGAGGVHTKRGTWSPGS
jgi:glycosyltransferase involved in cell wall biosynthesis